MTTLKAFIRNILIFNFFMPNAWAYIDPGSGILIWQGIIAAVGAILIFIRNPLQKIKSLIARFRRK